MVWCYVWLCILNVLSPKILFYFIKDTSNMQPTSQGWWIQFIVTKNVKEIPPKKKIVYSCYQDMVSPMYDVSYDQGFQEDFFNENCGQGHPVLIYISIINWSVQDLRRMVKLLRMKFGYVKYWNPL